jgi:hypothetical protein
MCIFLFERWNVLVRVRACKDGFHGEMNVLFGDMLFMGENFDVGIDIIEINIFEQFSRLCNRVEKVQVNIFNNFGVHGGLLIGG